MGTGALNAGVNLAMNQGAQTYSQSLHATENGDKRSPDGSLGTYADLSFFYLTLLPTRISKSAGFVFERLKIKSCPNWWNLN